jgi:hypothetical protein
MICTCQRPGDILNRQLLIDEIWNVPEISFSTSLLVMLMLLGPRKLFE